MEPRKSPNFGAPTQWTYAEGNMGPSLARDGYQLHAVEDLDHAGKQHVRKPGEPVAALRTRRGRIGKPEGVSR